jgi:Secretion system C-terminal sorting domain
MKTSIILLAFSTFLSAKLFAQVNDYFPLTVGSTFTYQYHEYTLHADFDPLNPNYSVWSKSSLDGFEFYSIVDSVSQSDTLIAWSIEQRDSLLLTDSSSNGQDDASWSTAKAVYLLLESKLGYHQLTNTDMRLWSMSPYSQYPVYRFASSSTDSLWVWIPIDLVSPQSPQNYANGYLRKNIGLTSYSYTSQIGGHTHIDQHIITSLLLSHTVQAVRIRNQNVKDFYLRHNYPNPFNPSTVITYSISKRSPTSLKIYDVLGRIVTTLVEEDQSPGLYSIIWDASSYASGIYLCRLESAGNTKTEILTFIK